MDNVQKVVLCTLSTTNRKHTAQDRVLLCVYGKLHSTSIPEIIHERKAFVDIFLQQLPTALLVIAVGTGVSTDTISSDCRKGVKGAWGRKGEGGFGGLWIGGGRSTPLLPHYRAAPRGGRHLLAIARKMRIVKIYGKKYGGEGSERSERLLPPKVPKCKPTDVVRGREREGGGYTNL